MAGFDRGAVFWALLGNGALTVTKFAAFVLSGSGAMMSEAIHSFADTTNQALLYVGIRRSQRPADEEFAYGYGADRYVFSLLAAASNIERKPLSFKVLPSIAALGMPLTSIIFSCRSPSSTANNFNP